MRLVLCYPVEQKHLREIASVAPHLELVEADQENIPELIHTADLFCGHAKVPVDWDRVVARGRLVWTQSSAAGLDWLLVPSVIDSPMIVTSASGVLGDQVAEHTVAILTAITRSLPVFFRAQQRKEYIRRPTRDLHHSTVGIVGFGGIGRRVSEVLAPFKTTILATDMFPIDKPSHVAELWPADRLDDMLAQSDIVILCLPLNSQTQWLFDRDRFARIKRGAIFLNMARGRLVVEEALVDALQEGHLFAAGADVAAEEPLSPASKLWELPNMLITPHVAGQSALRSDNMTNFFCDNLRRYLNGEPLRNLVNKRLGFPVRVNPQAQIAAVGWDQLAQQCEPCDRGVRRAQAHHRRLLVLAFDSQFKDSAFRPPTPPLPSSASLPRMNACTDATRSTHPELHFMTTTIFREGLATITFGGNPTARCPDELLSRYQSLIEEQRMSWTEHQRLLRLIGAGGQGQVYLSQRRGADGFTLPVALKIFSPERFEHAQAYDEAMERIARVAARVAQIQQDNLLDVHNFVDRRRIRMMEMEWIDGYDLNHLLSRNVLDRTRDQVSQTRWEYLNRVIVTSGPAQSRFKPGIAIQIVRDCLAALAALHREQIVHGDLKPSNIMIKRTGNAKIVDIGSAICLDDVPAQRTCTPTYSAPEVLEGHECTPRSDLASLGYVLIEMLAGRSPFAGMTTYRDLLEAKRFVAQRLPQMLPGEVACNELLMGFVKQLVAPDPTRRFPSAEAADMFNEGAAAFHRQLIVGGLASEYENEIRLWLEDLE